MAKIFCKVEMVFTSSFANSHAKIVHAKCLNIHLPIGRIGPKQNQGKLFYREAGFTEWCLHTTT